MFQERISQCTKVLTKSEKNILKFVSGKPDFVALHTAAEVGNEIGVSETTIIRFCYKLQFSGFKELQKYVQQSFVTKESTLGTYLSTNSLSGEADFAQAVMLKDANRIQSFSEQIEPSKFKEASVLLHKAKNIYVLGLRSSYAAAQWTSFTLNVVRNNVRLIQPDSQDFIHTISQMTSEDVVIVFSFHRYYKQTIDITTILHKQGVRIIGITDSLLAPIHRYSTVLFPLEQAQMSTIEMMPGIISFMNALVIGMTAEDPVAFEAYKEAYEAVDSGILFLDGDE